MLCDSVVIVNKRGLHARAAAKFSSTANLYTCDILIGRNAEDLVNGKSIMNVMMLAASQGTTLYLQVTGAQEQAALVALKDLINNRFDETE